MPEVDECCTKNITFDCTDEESSHFAARDSCRNFQGNFHADACSVIQNGSTGHNEEHSHCAFISILRQGSISIEKSHLNNISGLCLYQAKSKNFSDADVSSCGTQNCKSVKIVCSDNDSGNGPTSCNRNRMVWIFIYGTVVVLSYTSLTAAHRCFDVISADLSNRHNSDFGKQRLWSLLGASAGPSLAGLILEKTTSEESGKNYALIFVCAILFTILSIVPVWNISPEFHKPATRLWKKSLELMKKHEIFLFFLLLLTAGISFGFQMMYGNWYLQSLGAPDLLLGISKGISTLCGLPVLYASKWFFDKTGVRSFFVLSVLCHVFYSFGFSLMREPWLAMGFELANVFAYLLFWPAVMQYCEEVAPVEMQATMKGIAGVLHFNIARIGASMIGGYVMNNYGGRMAYQVIGYICLGYAAIYGMDLIIQYLRKEKTGVRLKRGNPQQLDPVCTVFVEKVPLEPTIPLNDALHTWFSSF
ncbi:hypothetical protein AVEN_91368-1 [Araneus ventricosus]|uniref:Major facilitator superfamily associated domain-containing protein n=2 Tax=Araneus ventricosus TaxID=182803 RepID=A0A4Y2LH56_ARAVE|nr:hypothetical protein AVEN_91368-1 [Araneus ventricosus]